MTQLRSIIAVHRPSIVLLLPLALWMLVWGGLEAGQIEDVLGSDDPTEVFDRLRGAFPLWAAYLATLLLLVKILKGREGGFSFFGPLGLTAVYGAVGLAASVLSPDGSVSLYWAAAYLSVPVVLWSIIWGGDGLGAVYRVINLNWLIIVLAVATLFILGLVYLDLGALILTPSSWFDCPLNKDWRGNSWLDLSSGSLRPTGVGRYAALAGILALGRLGQGKWRLLWFVILAAAGILLLTSGARGAYFGFAAAAALIIIYYSGKKTALWGALGLLVLVPVVLSTGIHKDFLNSCIFKQDRLGAPQVQQTSAPQVAILQDLVAAGYVPADLPLRMTVPLGNWILEKLPSSELDSLDVYDNLGPTTEDEDSSSISIGTPLISDEQSAVSPLARILVPKTVSESIFPLEGPAASSRYTSLRIPEGVWLLTRPPEQLTGEEQPLRILVDAGFRKLEQLPSDETLDPSLLYSGPSTRGLVTFTGRPSVWAEGFRIFKERPILGYGFHADRLLLGTHMHNFFVHALVQTGLAGTIPFVMALLLAWVLLVKALRNISRLPGVHRHLLIQVAGVLVFFSFRAIPESTGAFFSVDWLVLAPVLLYLQVVNQVVSGAEESNIHRAPGYVVPWKPVVSWLRKSPST